MMIARPDAISSHGGLDGWQVVDRVRIARDATQTLSATPRPFLRWAGSKRRLLTALAAELPSSFRTYHEPFLGGASLFFLLRPNAARLNDSCLPLIQTYSAVRDNPSAVLRFLAPLVPDRETYYRVRDRRSDAPFKRAAEFIFLNKACWNGLYRVNANGEFNVPFGTPKTNNLIDAPNLKACAETLSGEQIVLTSTDFQEALCHVEAGDLVFLDPPYVTGHNNNGFIDYNERLFCWADQERLAAEARRLRDAGATVIVTNAHHAEVLELYERFRCVRTGRSSTIASAHAARGRVSEAILISTPDD